MRELRRELYHDGPFERGAYLFRGVRDHEWELVSSFDRLFPAVRDRRSVFAGLMTATLVGAVPSTLTVWLFVVSVPALLEDENRTVVEELSVNGLL